MIGKTIAGLDVAERFIAEPSIMHKGWWVQ